MRVKNNTIVYVARASNSKRDCEHDLYVACCHGAKLCACCWGFPIAAKWCCDQDMEVVPEFSLHTKNMRSVWFVVKKRGCCCNLSVGVALIVRFTTNWTCVKNNTIIYIARANNSKRDCEHDLYCFLLPRCEALRTCRSGFPIATIPTRAVRPEQETKQFWMNGTEARHFWMLHLGPKCWVQAPQAYIVGLASCANNTMFLSL